MCSGSPPRIRACFLPLAEQQVIRLPVHDLARLQAERPRARPPPASRRLSPAVARLDVIASRVPSGTAVDMTPDVAKVVALAESRDDRQRRLLPDAGGDGTDHDGSCEWALRQAASPSARTRLDR